MRYTLGVLLILSVLLLGGCGGSGVQPPVQSGNLLVTVRFPETSRLIPANTRAVKLTLSQNLTPKATAVLSRQQGQEVQYQFTRLPAGVYVLFASAHPDDNATTTATAQGAVEVTVLPDQTTTVRLRLNSTVERIVVSRQGPLNLAPGSQIQLSAVGLNAEGEYVPLSSNRLRWESSDPNVAQVDANGVVTILASAPCTITVYDEESQRSGTYTLMGEGGEQSTPLPPGEWIVLSQMMTPQTARLIAVNPNNPSERHVLTNPADGIQGDKYATYRAGGDYILFTHIESTSLNSLHAYNWRTGRITTLDSGLIWPIFATDGQYAVYAKKDSQWDLYEVEIATGTVRRITTTPEDELDPALSPDGSTILCAQSRRLVEVNRATGAITPLPLSGYDYIFFPAYSPDGNHIVFIGRQGTVVTLSVLRARSSTYAIAPNVVRFAFIDNDTVLYAFLNSGGLWRGSLASGASQRVSLRTPKLGFAVSPDGTRAVICDSTFKVLLVDLATGSDQPLLDTTHTLPIWINLGTRSRAGGAVSAIDVLRPWAGTGLLPEPYEQLLRMAQ
ncbi:MAG: hypothetical protein KatS3mg021_2751 [Fimbriimonadales bacterium]|nr:MAG: hypothetical protein KatS3mg021_2751 [Fimbriimonadales bacterium]